MRQRSVRTVLALALVTMSGQALAQQPETLVPVFGWKPGLEALVTTTQRMVQTGQGRDSDLTISIQQRMRVSEHQQGLLVSHLDGQLLEATALPPGTENPVLDLYRSLGTADAHYVISGEGELLSLEGVAKTAEAVRTALAPMLESVQNTPETAQLVGMVEAALSDEAMLASVADQWSSMTVMWAGQELEEAAVYGFELEEPNPLAPTLLIPMSVEISYQGRVACEEGGSASDCVLLEFRSYPEPEAFAAFLQSFIEQLVPEAATRSVDYDFEQLNSITVVTEPDTLVPHRFSTSRQMELTVSFEGQSFGMSRLNSTDQQFDYETRRR